MSNALVITIAHLPGNFDELLVCLNRLIRRIKPNTAIFPERKENPHNIIGMIIWVHELMARIQHDTIVVEIQIGIDEQRILVPMLIILVEIDGIEVLDSVEVIHQTEVVFVADFGHNMLALLLYGGLSGLVAFQLAAVEMHIAIAIFALVLVPGSEDVAELVGHDRESVATWVSIFEGFVEAHEVAIWVTVCLLRD